MGKAAFFLQTYLAQQWWRSIHGTNAPEIFEKIIKILNEKSYADIKRPNRNSKIFLIFQNIILNDKTFY